VFGYSLWIHCSSLDLARSSPPHERPMDTSTETSLFNLKKWKNSAEATPPLSRDVVGFGVRLNGGGRQWAKHRVGGTAKHEP
jgi:hypothetical protein